MKHVYNMHYIVYNEKVIWMVIYCSLFVFRSTGTSARAPSTASTLRCHPLLAWVCHLTLEDNRDNPLGQVSDEGNLSTAMSSGQHESIIAILIRFM